MRRRFVGLRTIVITALLTAAIMLVLLYAPSPFVVTKPGIAVPTDRYIRLVEQISGATVKENIQAKDEISAGSNGQFLLTAILLETPSIWESLKSIFIPSHDVKLKYDVLGDATIEQYATTVTTMMQGSHYNAIEAAYRYLGIDYSIEPQSLVVQQTAAHSGGGNKLKPGDKIIAAASASEEAEGIASIEQLANWLKEQAASNSQQVSIVAEREQNQFEIELDISDLDLSLANDQLVAQTLRVVSFVEMRSIMPIDEQYKLEILTDNIGGPSAGLAFALTIIDRLTEGDLAKGKSIAVTGTIDPYGKVGVIGGIKQKVHVTSERGAELFLVPKKNEREAKRALKSIDSRMEVAGVTSLEEAIELLASIH